MGKYPKNDLFLSSLFRIYGHGFFKLSCMLMRKNVNNDVSKDSPNLLLRLYLLNDRLVIMPPLFSCKVVKGSGYAILVSNVLSLALGWRNLLGGGGGVETGGTRWYGHSFEIYKIKMPAIGPVTCKFYWPSNLSLFLYCFSRKMHLWRFIASF